MAKPTIALTTIAGMESGWATQVDDNEAAIVAHLEDGPLPIFEGGDIAAFISGNGLGANQWDRSIAFSNDTSESLGWTLLMSDGSGWVKIPKQCALVADASGWADATAQAKFNALLAALKAAGAMAHT